MSEMNLAGINAKLHRAEEQINKITDVAHKLCNDVEQGIVREVRQDLGQQVWLYPGPPPTVLVEWSVILGEILHNLRSALDHLVWQLVLANGQTPGRHNKFPIFADHDKWLQEKVKFLKGVSIRHEAMVGHLQPYTGGISLPFDVSMLKVLDELNNIEKHRHLILAVIVSKGIEPLDSQLDDSSTRSPLSGSFVIGKIETDRVLLRLDNADMAIVPSFKVDVGIANTDLQGRTLPRILDKCLRTVEGCVQFLTGPMGYWFVERPRRP